MNDAVATALFHCAGCSVAHARWFPQCPGCGRFNSLSAQIAPATAIAGASPALFATITAREPARAAFASPALIRTGIATEPSDANGNDDNDSDSDDEHADVPITDVDDTIEERIHTGIAPLDMVLGGGLVVGGLVLLGGEPGAGKSTLTMQAAHGLATNEDSTVLYATAEESIAQVAMRARRIDGAHERIRIMACDDVDLILRRARHRAPTALIIDSISKMTTADVAGIAGSVSQVKECVGRINLFARETGCTVLLIGHVTRDGTIAGPRTLDHLVDVVLSFEKGHDENGNETAIRFLRSHKNRFGDATEVGALEMTATGLVPSFHEPDDMYESLVPVMQEILNRYRALGGVVDEGLRDRIAGRLACDDAL